MSENGFLKNSSRTHDKFYLEEDYFTKPKEVFKLVTPLVLESLNLNDNSQSKSILDVGCANADFLRYLNLIIKTNKEISLYGLDVMEVLLDRAEEAFPIASYYKADIRDRQKLDEIFGGEKFDLVTMLAVHSAFDDLEWIKNLISLTTSNGSIILSGPFNPYPYDVITRVKKSESTRYEEGWNVHSQESIKRECEKLGYEAKFVDYEPDMDIKRRVEDGLRSWTVDLAPNQNSNLIKEKENAWIYEKDRKRIFTCATRIILDLGFCVISKK